MDSEEFAEMLRDLLQSPPDDSLFLEDFMDVKQVRTFEEKMLLTSNAGVVLNLADGSEYQITVVRSRRPKD